jgi:hypothetical protein
LLQGINYICNRKPLFYGCGIVEFFTAFVIQMSNNYPSIEKEAFSLTESIVSANEDSKGKPLSKGEALFDESEDNENIFVEEQKRSLEIVNTTCDE